MFYSYYLYSLDYCCNNIFRFTVIIVVLTKIVGNSTEVVAAAVAVVGKKEYVRNGNRKSTVDSESVNDKNVPFRMTG